MLKLNYDLMTGSIPFDSLFTEIVFDVFNFNLVLCFSLGNQAESGAQPIC